ncbi:MAG: T9SS type A sorting domain-containing protein [Bacteroidia bacterium]|nr:T9SS type A sorting domain-containing protein [Bacteroidia bacterium]
MKKIFYLSSVAMCLFMLKLTAQTQLIFEDFESYTAGQKLDQQSTQPYWTTWSNSPGSAEDPFVSTDQAYGGTKSVKIVANNDLVMLFNDKTTGRYQLEFYIYVVTNKVGYFNILQNFAGNSSEWGMQVFFNVNDTGTVDAGGQSAGLFTFNHNEWLYVNAIIDVDDDFATLYINNTEVVSWVWSGGSYGDGTTHKLDAANFYGWTDDNGNASLAYFDDIEFTEQITLSPPLNLQASVNTDDIVLTWESPIGPTPESYNMTRNGDVIATGIAGLLYNDNNLYPNTYSYFVRGHIAGLGYTPSSNTAGGTIAGGVPRELVVLEIGTGTWCQYCPGAAMGADDLYEGGQNVAIIEYHDGDDYANDFAASRILYYNITGFPTAEFDGKIEHVGGSATESLYPAYLPSYNERISIPAVYNITLDVTGASETNYTATITVEETYPYFTSNLRLHCVLTESYIPEVWQGQTEVNFVCREMYPDANGFPLDFSAQTTQTEIVNFNLDPTYIKNNCEFIVFVQHVTSKEIIQAAKVDLENVIVNISELQKQNTTIYPNPAKDYINIYAPGMKKLCLTSLTGEKIFETENQTDYYRLNTHNFARGIYLLSIVSDKGSEYHKLVIR